MKHGKKEIVKAFKAAFPYTVPIFAGFWFLGLTYGIYMNVSGFSFVYPMIMSLVIFAGSVEFVTVNMLLSPFYTRRHMRFAAEIQYQRNRIFHDGTVCRYLSRTVAERK